MSSFPLLLFLSCGDKEHSPDDTTATSDTDTQPQDTGPVVPDPPDNFTLVTSGEMTENLSFDAPTCTLTNGAPNFYAFWRSSSQSHVFVLKVELRGIYDGAGSYTGEQGLTIKLQEEAGGAGRFFQSDSTQDSVTLTLETNEEGYIFGDASIANMHSSSGSISLSPSTFPIWCSPDNTN